MTVVAIHQPQFLPWLGYFNKLDRSDVFCLLDTVQYKKNEFQNRNRIKTADGWQWLTVPVTYRFPQRIREVGVNQTVNWQRKHLQALRSNYSKAPFFESYYASFEEFCHQPYEMIVDVNVASIELLMQLLGLERKLVLASSLQVDTEDPTLRLVQICQTLGGAAYLSGKDGAKYMDVDMFASHEIDVLFQDFKHPQYPQCYGPFEPNMSVVDLLFNCGPDSLAIIREAST
ncbi:MAG: WbqC family protein [Syntrophobacterales bacterium]|jgi:hypothetical protein